MANTYGQLSENSDNKISLNDFEKEVGKRLKQYVLIKFNTKHVKLCRKLYKQGYTISDTVSMLILNS
jgi:methyltransferase-like protein